MLEIPQRISLSAQIAAAIRSGIERGVWADCLPGERRLCATFQASRPTVRIALASLARDGWFEIRQGRPNRLRRPGGRRTAAAARTVGIIIHEPFSQLSPTIVQGLGEMRMHLAEQGCATEIYVCPSAGARAQSRGLEAFVRRNRISSCVLVSVSRAIQRWFCEHAVPALVLGSCHPSVKLPSLDIDYRAVCHHAAGVFLGRGHRRLALVIPDSGTPGDLVSEESFRAAIEQQPGASVVVVRHNGTAPHLTAKLGTLFRSPHPPTGLLVTRTPHVFAVIMHLLNRGLGVPDAVSLIARDSDPMFAAVDPPLAHYAFKSDAYIRQMCRLMLKLVAERPPAKPILIVPKFFPGRTVRVLAPTPILPHSSSTS